ncbi:MAG: hypothetical protein ACYDEX_12140 [Mobilitalea sp.]
MREIATVFSCLIISPITGSIFSILIFISLLAAFFLLGLIFGLISNPERKRKEKKLVSEEQKVTLQNTDVNNTLEQDNLVNENKRSAAPAPSDPVHYNYW